MYSSIVTSIFMGIEDRDALVKFLANSTAIKVSDPSGRSSFLTDVGLDRISDKVNYNQDPLGFARELLQVLEAQDELLDDPPGYHPVGALCDYFILEVRHPVSKNDRRVLARLAVQYGLVSDARITELKDEFDIPNSTTPWRQLRTVPGQDALEISESEYSQRVENFLNEYLGTESQEILFGGREDQIQVLDRWLKSPAHGQHALLAAQAGRGKSALLCHWQQSVKERHEAHVVFVPISIRFQTASEHATYEILANEIARIYGQRRDFHNWAPERLQDYYLKTLGQTPEDGRVVLIVLDGLDEAQDNQVNSNLFPASLPMHVRVVCSVRDVDASRWIKRLGWRVKDQVMLMDLPPLNPSGIREVVLSESSPLSELPVSESAINAISRVTEGEPLTLRLYLDSLRSLHSSERLKRLSNIAQNTGVGLGGYIRDFWLVDQKAIWASQGRDSVSEMRLYDSFLYACASAFGPVSAYYLYEIAADVFSSPEEVKRIAHACSRFILSADGTSRLTFAHPALQNYFWDVMTRKQRIEWNHRFFQSGMVVHQEFIENPSSEPTGLEYVLENQLGHLARAVDDQVLSVNAVDSVLTKGWMRAREFKERGHLGFVRDVRRAWQITIAVGDICGQINCAFMTSSIASLRSNMQPNLLSNALRQGVVSWAQAISWLHEMADEHHRVRCLEKIAPHADASRLTELASVVDTFRNEYWRAEALGYLAPLLAGAGASVAKSLALIIERPQLRVLVLLKFMEQSRLESRYELARYAYELATSIGSCGSKLSSLIMLVPELPKDERKLALDVAMSMLEQLEDDSERLRQLVELVPYLSQDTRIRVELEIVNAIDAEDDLGKKRRLFEDYLPVASVIFFPKLETHVYSVSDPRSRGEMLVSLAEVYVAQRHLLLLEASACFPSLDEGSRANLIYRIVPIADDDIMQILSRAVDDMLSPDAKASGLASIALGQIGHQRHKTIETSLAVLQTIEHPFEYHNTAALLINRLSNDVPRGLIDSVVASLVNESKNRSFVFVQDENWAHSMLDRIAPFMTTDQLSEAVAAMRHIDDILAQTRLIRELLPHLDEEDHVLLLQYAENMRHEYPRSWVLVDLAAFLSPELASKGLILAREIQEETPRLRSGLAMSSRVGEQAFLEELELLNQTLQSSTDLRKTAILYMHALECAATLGKESALFGDLLKNALDAARGIDSTPKRIEQLMRAVVVTEGTLRDELVAEVTQEMRTLTDEKQITSLIALASQILDAPEADYYYERAMKMTQSDYKVELLTRILPLLDQPSRASALEEALDDAELIADDFVRASRLAALIEFADHEARSGILQKIIEISRSQSQPEMRLILLTRAAAYLTTDAKVSLLREAAGAWTTTSPEIMLDRLAPFLDPSDEKVEVALSDALLLLGARRRAEFMLGLKALLPAYLSLTGDPSLGSKRILASVVRATDWWP